MEKICSKCKKKKDLKCFSINKSKEDGLQTHCKTCSRETSRLHYLNNKEKYYKRNKKRRADFKVWFKKYKENLSCSSCGEDRWWVLDFHHKNPETKEYNIADLLRGRVSKENMLKEISKCEVLCSNCHRDLHYKERLL